MSGDETPRQLERRELSQRTSAVTPMQAPAESDLAVSSESLASSRSARRGLGEVVPDEPAVQKAPHEVIGGSGIEAPITLSAAAQPEIGTPAVDRSPQATAIPVLRPRPGRLPRRWLTIGVVAVGVSVLVLAAARLLTGFPAIKDFLVTYPGEVRLPESAPEGFPEWLAWQHFVNAFFLILMIKTGWQVRTQKRPPASWTRHNTRFFRGRNPPQKISLTLWLHLSLDVLWLLNGIVFVIVLFVSGQWIRVVPTTLDVIPNALSAGLQYASLHWPTENGWANYNSLQLLAYFTTIFIAAPLAALTGARMSGAWPKDATRLNRLFPIGLARAVHFPVMLYFVLFVIAHVTLVLATGAMRNLNHMYGGQDAVNLTGTIIFVASVLVMTGAWVAARPLVVMPIAKCFGKVGR